MSRGQNKQHAGRNTANVHGPASHVTHVRAEDIQMMNRDKLGDGNAVCHDSLGRCCSTIVFVFLHHAGYRHDCIPYTHSSDKRVQIGELRLLLLALQVQCCAAEPRITD